MAQNTQNPQSAGPGMLAAIPFVFFGIVLALFWHVKHDSMAYMILKYCYWITLPFAKICSLIGWDSAPPVDLIRKIVRGAQIIPKLNAGDMLTVLNKSGMYYLPLLYFPIKVAIDAHKHPVNSCYTTHNTWTLIQAQSKFNPCIIPVVRFEGVWRKDSKKRHPNIRRAQTPHEFVVQHKLLASDGMDVYIDVIKTREAFIKQLGDKIDPSNFDKLPAHYRALAAIFMIRITGAGTGKRNKKARDEAQKLLDNINLSCDPSKDPSKAFSFAEASKKFDEYIKHPMIQNILQSHTFQKTFLMRLLFEARSDGKIPCSQFIWLKMIDRPLYYCMQCVTPKQIARGFVEAAGPNAHYWAEMVAAEHGRALIEPHIEHAIPALEHRLFDLNVITKTSELYKKEDF